MARIRTIKPEFPQSESIGRLSRDARLLFVLIWTIADDSGRLRAASRMLASLLFPFDDDAPGLIDGWLAELEREGCLRRYVVDGTTYAEVVNWQKHQKIDRPSESKLPEFARTREDSRSLAADLGPRTLDLGPRTIVGASAAPPPGDAREAGSEPPPRKPRGEYAFEGKVIKVNARHLAAWAKACPALEEAGGVQAFLLKRDAWLSNGKASDADRRSWFCSTPQWLANENARIALELKKAREGPETWDPNE